MDKLEHYLDQVCRSMGGPRELRQHVRQELREHLLDAVAQYKAAGVPEDRAMERALTDFGGPEQVRAELEATHGHRAFAVTIDKAIEWKEMTMRAKWLWVSWANLAAAVVIMLEALWITFNVIFIVPRYKLLLFVGVLDRNLLDEQGVGWMPGYIDGVSHVFGNHTTGLLLLSAAAWGLFEWRVRGDNKSFMRLAALGTVAVSLMLVIVVASSAMDVSFTLAVPSLGQMSRPYAVEQVAAVEKAMGELEAARLKNDWEAMREPAQKATAALTRLGAGPALSALMAERQELPELRERQKEVSAALAEAQQASAEKDASRLEAALRRAQQSFAPLLLAAKRAR